MSAKAKASEALAAGKDAIEQVVANGAEAAAKGIEQAQVVMQEQMETVMKNATGAFKAVEDVVQFGKGNIDAVVKANEILVAGLQEIGRTTVAQAQAALEEGMANARALAAVKSVKEAVDLQTGYARAAMEKALAQFAATQETTLKLVERAMAPVADRAKLAVSTFAKPLAA